MEKPVEEEEEEEGNQRLNEMKEWHTPSSIEAN
jgi:hypothetical protein